MSLLKPFYILAGALHLLFVYLTLFLNCNVLPVISWFFLRPLSEMYHERFLCFASERAWGLLLDWAQCIGGLSLIVTGDVDIIKEKSQGSKLIISNHVSFTDAFVIFALARSVGQHGHVRSFAKKTLSYQPVFGWFWYILNFIFLARDWDKDRAQISLQLNALALRARHFSSRAFWILIFPEGTRSRPSKLKQAREFAASRGQEPFDHVLFPRVKGLQATLAAIGPALDGAIDVTIGYPTRTASGHARPSVGDLLFGGGAVWAVHVHVRVVPAAEMPADADATAAWAMQRFREKDRLLAAFAADGAFPGAPKALPAPPVAAFARRHAEFAAAAGMVLAALWAAGHAAAAVAT
jgi:1-acyl-sn-glycerol-3-phosphate acyltransferase